MKNVSIISQWKLLSMNASTNHWKLTTNQGQKMLWLNMIDLSCYRRISIDNNWFSMTKIYFDWRLVKVAQL